MKKIWIIAVILGLLLFSFFIGWISIEFHNIANEWEFPYMTQNSQMKQVYDENKECFNKIKKSLCDNNIQTGFIVHPNDTNSYWNNYRETIKQNIPEDIVGDVLYLVDNYKINDFFISDTYITFEQSKPSGSGKNCINVMLIFDKTNNCWLLGSNLVLGRNKSSFIHKLYKQIYGRPQYI